MTKKVLPNEMVLEEACRLLEEGREVVITPLGNSMLPFIRGGKDEVTLKVMPHIEVGDIVLARLPGPSYVLHRVVDRNRSLLTLMGDGYGRKALHKFYWNRDLTRKRPCRHYCRSTFFRRRHRCRTPRIIRA